MPDSSGIWCTTSQNVDTTFWQIRISGHLPVPLPVSAVMTRCQKTPWPLPPPRCAWVSAEQLCKLQGFFDDSEPEAADTAYAAKQALSEFASANDATRDAFFEWLGLERRHIFTRVLSNAGVLY